MFVFAASQRALSLVADAPSACRKEIDHERYYQTGNRPECPPSAEPVMNRGIPEERGGKKHISDDRPKHVVEHAPEPGGEEPEQRGDESRRGEGEKGEQARHRYGLRIGSITRTPRIYSTLSKDLDPAQSRGGGPVQSPQSAIMSVRAILRFTVPLTCLLQPTLITSSQECPINHALPSSSAPHGRRSESSLGDY